MVVSRGQFETVKCQDRFVIEERAELLYQDWPGGGAIALPKSLQLNVNLKMVPGINSHLSRKK